MAAYAASKGGVAALTHTLAVEYAKRGVRVNAIAPGSVRTSMTKGLDFPADADFDLIARIMSPIGPGDPASVAAVVALLASDDGAHISGEVIRIDGGTHA
jgi:NAD(P)-dependent dehydrogenase (short-subunit alcohol dehydrogenase family)